MECSAADEWEKEACYLKPVKKGYISYFYHNQASADHQVGVGWSVQYTDSPCRYCGALQYYETSGLIVMCGNSGTDFRENHLHSKQIIGKIDISH